MKRKIEIDRIFQELRQLPPEIPFSRVEQWVRQHRPSPVQSSSWLTKCLSIWKNWN